VSLAFARNITTFFFAHVLNSELLAGIEEKLKLIRSMGRKNTLVMADEHACYICIVI
jgi:hypothetical protein